MPATRLSWSALVVEAAARLQQLAMKGQAAAAARI